MGLATELSDNGRLWTGKSARPTFPRELAQKKNGTHVFTQVPLFWLRTPLGDYLINSFSVLPPFELAERREDGRRLVRGLSAPESWETMIGSDVRRCSLVVRVDSP